MVCFPRTTLKFVEQIQLLACENDIVIATGNHSLSLFIHNSWTLVIIF